MKIVEIKEIEKINLNKPILVEGFPGVGMIGTTAVMYLIKELKMDLCGYLTSPKFPPFATIHDGVPLSPARIYKSDKYNILVILSEFAIPMNSVHAVCEEIIRWAKKKKVRVIYSLGGINIKVPEEEIDRVFGISTTEETKKLLEAKGITIIKEGITTGVTGVILADSYTRKFPAISLLTPSRPIGIDLLSAAAVLKALSNLENIPLSTDKLVKEGKYIEEKIKEIMKGVKEASERYKKIEEYTPTYR